MSLLVAPALPDATAGACDPRSSYGAGRWFEAKPFVRRDQSIRLIQQLTHAGAPSTATHTHSATPQTYFHKSAYAGQLPIYAAQVQPVQQQQQQQFAFPYGSSANAPQRCYAPYASQAQLQQQQQQQQQSRYHYANMLKSARQALHTLQASTSSQRRPQQCALPGGFFVLNPSDSQPAICMPNSPQNAQSQLQSQRSRRPSVPSITVAAPAPPPPPQQQQQQQPQQPQPQQMFLPIFPVCAPIQQTVAPTPAKPKTTPLKKEYLETVSKDTRMMRWQRVLSYINAQRAHVAALQKRREELATAGRQRSTSLSLNRSNRSGDFSVPASWANAQLMMEEEDEDTRSLWSGGSAGTDGVDEFVWDEDLEDDDRNLPSGAVTPHHEDGEDMFVLDEESPAQGARMGGMGGGLGFGGRGFGGMTFLPVAPVGNYRAEVRA